jgi:DNA-binding MarR family transcriptional regulator
MRLTVEQWKILDFMAPAAGEGLTLAHDIASDLGIAPRAMGAKLRALESRGLVHRAIARKRASMRCDHLYGWELTERGLDEVLP